MRRRARRRGLGLIGDVGLAHGEDHRRARVLRGAVHHDLTGKGRESAIAIEVRPFCGFGTPRERREQEEPDCDGEGPHARAVRALAVRGAP
jgi:hypothetical protein